MTGDMALSYCRALGYDWGGLYETFSRVGCAWCPKGGKRKLALLQQHRPELYREYERLNALSPAQDTQG